jgi:glycosyltransferase involved in cell wall biosynthesis
MSSLKVLYNHRIASRDGQSVHIDEIIRALKEQGHEVTLISPDMGEAQDFGDDGGFVSRLKQSLPKFVYELMEFAYSGLIAIKLAKSIRANRPDVIYERFNLYQPAGVLISKVFKIPLILEVNAPLKEERERFCGGLAMPWLAKKIENWTWRNADHVLPVTNVLADHLRNANVPETKITVIHNGIRQTALDEFAKRVPQVDETITIGFVGFMNLTCGLDKAIDMIAEHQDKPLRLLCVGNGDVVDELKEQAERLGVLDKIEFTGLVTREEVFAHMKRFDIALQPDVTAYASPLKMFEYMVVKSLIVAPRVPNICEILDDDCAILFDNKKAGAFEEALTLAVEEFAQHQRKREAAFTRLIKNDFIWQRNSEKIIGIARSLRGETTEPLERKPSSISNPE